MKRLFALIISLPLFLSACMYDADQQDTASQVVDQWHAAYQTGNWEQVLSPYDKSFFKEKPSELWLKELQGYTDKLGPLKDTHQVFNQKDPRFNGDYYMYGYTLIFEKGRMDEVITVFRALDSDKLLIAGHMIKPKK